MKIVDLKCPSCGGKLVPVEGNSKIVTCEYCNSQFVLEEDQVINYHIHQYGSQKPQDGLPRAADKNTSTPVNPALLVALPFLIIGAIFTFSMAFNHSKPAEKPTMPSFSLSDGAYPTGAMDIEGMEDLEEGQAVQGSGSPFYQAMVEGIFGKTADSVTPQELEQVQYLSIEHLADYSMITYSFDDPYGEEEPQVETIQVVKANRTPGDLAAFTGVKKLGLGYEQPDSTVFAALKDLKGIAGYKLELTQLAQMVDPAQILELDLEKPEGLEGIGAFENLEILSLERVESPDIKQLVPLGHLKSLSIEEYDGGEGKSFTDYSALSTLTGLESLHIDSPSIRDFGFMKGLKGLTKLSIEGTEAIGIEPLSELTQLTSLTLADNRQVKDYSPITSLTGLTSLNLDKETSQEDPDLSSLTGLTELTISGFMSVSFLRNMGGIKELAIHSCNIDEVSALSSLSGLETLSLYGVWTYAVPLKGLSFVDGMTALKVLDLGGDRSEDDWASFGYNVEIYGDISNVFDHPGLEELYLNDCLFEIDFDRIGENPSLKKLDMGGIALKENCYVETYNGMTDIWYDDVNFDEHTDFLTRFPNLEELYLDGDQITNIQFASSLKQLTRLGLKDNYVTDLSPLNQAEHLRYLDVRENPVSNSIEAGEDVVILR